VTNPAFAALPSVLDRALPALAYFHQTDATYTLNIAPPALANLKEYVRLDKALSTAFPQIVRLPAVHTPEIARPARRMRAL
jgi:hypothetical protein